MTCWPGGGRIRSPQSHWVDDALYYEIRVHVDRAECEQATARFALLQSLFPDSPEVPLAENYLNDGC